MIRYDTRAPAGSVSRSGTPSPTSVISDTCRAWVDATTTALAAGAGGDPAGDVSVTMPIVAAVCFPTVNTQAPTPAAVRGRQSCRHSKRRPAPSPSPAAGMSRQDAAMPGRPGTGTI
ncbi:hypothetical protein FRACA_110038 [Frankia canadensis]|uniref:Uncharacterized protein n=1 Tax=Frankia canadensis TaxID=1836972 RepID=A0A2I2KJ92_9ACTN|nr:hypothetical protein FRACA_110038 [Frankia canadensis]SOU53014.1 hypothetical protein FRACA_110038 [Frankia canadensis]